MHWLLRLALLLNVVLTVSAGGIFAMNAEELFPSGPDAELTISSAENADTAALADLAAQHHVSLAQATYASDEDGPHRIITVLTQGDDTTGGLPVEHPYPDYGFDADTEVRVAEDYTFSPLGRWIAFGTGEHIEQFVAELSASGFTIFFSDSVDAGRLLRNYFATPFWMLQAAGVAVTFVAALVSAQASTRIRAVGAMHGRTTGQMVGIEVGRYAVYAAALGAIGWLAWAATGLVAWHGGQTFGFAGTVFSVILVSAVLASVILTSLAVVVTAVAVPGLLDQLNGKRPLRLTYWAAVGTLLVTLSGAFASLGYAQSAATNASDFRDHAEQLLSSPEGFTIGLWGSDEAAVHNVLPQWRRFIDESDRQGTLRMTGYEPACDTLETALPCVFVNATAARDMGIDDVQHGHIRLTLPEAEKSNEVQLRESLHEFLQFEQEIDAQDSITTTAYGVDDIDITTNPDGHSIDVNTASGSPSGGGKVTDPIIVTVPVDAVSANTHYAWTTSGSEIFSYPSAGALVASLDEHEAGELVGWVERPRDKAEAQAIAATRELTHFTVISVVTVSGVFILGILLAIVYCEHRRRPLFVQHLNGARLPARYGPYFVAVVGIGLLSLLMIPGIDALTWGMRLGVVVLLIAAGAVTVYVRDRTLRADTIKHP